jgi:hypothetical protein
MFLAGGGRAQQASAYEDSTCSRVVATETRARELPSGSRLWARRRRRFGIDRRNKTLKKDRERNGNGKQFFATRQFLLTVLVHSYYVVAVFSRQPRPQRTTTTKRSVLGQAPRPCIAGLRGTASCIASCCVSLSVIGMPMFVPSHQRAAACSFSIVARSFSTSAESSGKVPVASLL